MNNEWIEVSGKTVDDAITEALIKLQTVTDKMEYEILEKESSGIFGIFGKHEAKIRARIKGAKANTDVKEVREERKLNANAIRKDSEASLNVGVSERKPLMNYTEQPVIKPVSEETAANAEKKVKEFLGDIFKAMELKAEINISFDKNENELSVDVRADDMGVLIGKRGQTLDSLQYILSLAVNKGLEEYIKIKLDSENYRTRRKETLENLAKNIALKVKRTGKTVSLEPMNSFERRIIHSALQNDDECETYSEGNEPYRKVVVKLKGEKRRYNGKYNNKSYGSKKPYGKKNYSKNYGGYNRNYNDRKYVSEEKSFDKKDFNEANE